MHKAHDVAAAITIRYKAIMSTEKLIQIIPFLVFLGLELFTYYFLNLILRPQHFNYSVFNSGSTQIKQKRLTIY